MDIRQGGVTPKDTQAPGNALDPFDIQVDGGVDDKTAPLCVKAGANELVSGTYLFKGDDMKKKIADFKGLTR